MAGYHTLAPTSGQVIESTGGSASVTFKWNGTPQYAYKLKYRLVDGEGWTEVSDSGSTQTKTLTIPDGDYVWHVECEVITSPSQWQWTDTSTFGVHPAPTVTVVNPANSSTVTSLPIQYEVTFSDSNGVFESGTIQLVNALNYQDVLWSSEVTSDAALTGSIAADDMAHLPQNGNYTLSASLRSSTGLGSADMSTFAINIAGTDQGTLSVTNDPLTGYATLLVGWDNTGGVHAASASLYRITDNGRVMLADNLTTASTFVDKYAPLNVEYQYEVVTHAEPTAVTSKKFTNTISTDRWFVIWANGAKQAWAIWNPSGGYDYKRPQKKRVHYVGREYPVSYDGTALDEEHSISFTVLDRDSWTNAFIELMHDGGRGVYKSVDGKVFWADVDISCTPKYTSLTKIGTVSVGIVRIEGDAV